jgi:hypothetical protein
MKRKTNGPNIVPQKTGKQVPGGKVKLPVGIRKRKGKRKV